MGSLDSTPKELTVLVTGFGPFKEDCPVNPSGEIAASLPDYLPAVRAKDPAGQASSLNIPPVRILKLPEPVHVSYEVVRNLVPTLWDNPEHKIDYAIHIGMAGPQLVYSLERRAHRDGYDKADVDGKFLRDEERHLEEGKDWIWHGLPGELLTDLDIVDVYRTCVERGPGTIIFFLKYSSLGIYRYGYGLYPLWLTCIRPLLSRLKALHLQISDDPGRYMCDFIYFSSLAHLEKQKRPKKVIFLHVPQYSDQKSLSLGKEIVLTLVRAIVESDLGKKSPARH
ncbi:putative pyroglutamyl peptidase type I [Biscogniauxia mediterranea]|nr:putative pyroglutamyl peptidase type I [Biscogniauxia mediterranea]